MTVATHEPTTTEVMVGEQKITFETGRLAKQASGSVYVTAGGTAVLATAVGRPEPKPGQGFFPLTVDIEEKMYAAGKIPGGFFKREGRAGEKATLTARMIDRPIRPLWPKGYKNDVHCVATTMSVDMENSHDVLAINGISAALMLSPLPFMGPVGAVRVGLIDDELRINPPMPEMLESKLDLIVCGTTEAITMVEAGADIIDEERIIEALALAHESIKVVCAAQVELAEKAGKPKWTTADHIDEMTGRYADRIREAMQGQGVAAIGEFVDGTLVADAAPAIDLSSTEDDIAARMRAKLTLGIVADKVLLDEMKTIVDDQFGELITELTEGEQDSKELKSAKRDVLVDKVLAGINLPFPSGDDGVDDATTGLIKAAVDAVYKDKVRAKIAVDRRRPDGRSEREIRTITTEIGVAPKVHGAGLFTRGQTQVMTLITLGSTKEEQRIDDLSLETNKYYLHHYNFPPFSVGETGFMRGPKRRDIGHGALAERALVPVIPDLEEFPYTIRAVSETLESNGSSSMASVCGSTLGLMDAGVPIKAPVAGIAMGLIQEGDSLTILTDIQGAEDHLGDMDFKVAGTRDGVTAMQMDIKITGVTTELLRDALAQAKEARLSILDTMAETIAEPRPEVNENAPRIEVVQIDSDYIGMVIGKGGETIRALEEEHAASITIEEDGTIYVYGADVHAARSAVAAIEDLTREIGVGEEFDGEVVKITDFGAFVQLRKGVDGLLHISNMSNKRVDRVEDVVERGDVIGVRVTSVDEARGRIGLVLIRDKDGNPVEIDPDKGGPGGGGGGGNRGGGGGRGRGGSGGGGGRGRGGSGGGGGGGNRNRNRGGGGGGGNRGGGGGGGNRNRNRNGGGEPKSQGSGAGGDGNRRRRTRGGESSDSSNKNAGGGNAGQRESKQQKPAAKDESGDGGFARRFLRRG